MHVCLPWHSVHMQTHTAPCKQLSKEAVKRNDMLKALPKNHSRSFCLWEAFLLTSRIGISLRSWRRSDISQGTSKLQGATCEIKHGSECSYQWNGYPLFSRSNYHTFGFKGVLGEKFEGNMVNFHRVPFNILQKNISIFGKWLKKSLISLLMGWVQFSEKDHQRELLTFPLKSKGITHTSGVQNLGAELRKTPNRLEFWQKILSYGFQWIHFPLWSPKG